MKRKKGSKSHSSSLSVSLSLSKERERERERERHLREIRRETREVSIQKTVIGRFDSSFSLRRRRRRPTTTTTQNERERERERERKQQRQRKRPSSMIDARFFSLSLWVGTQWKQRARTFFVFSVGCGGLSHSRRDVKMYTCIGFL